jgi:hypothetical protein
VKTQLTEEQLRELVATSASFREMAIRMGMSGQSGQSRKTVTKMVRALGIDTSHFVRPKFKMHWSEVLVLREAGNRQESFRLRRALLECGRLYQCEFCGLGDTWNGKPLTLQVDHKNNNWLDDRSENIRFLCANCHSQTDGYNGRATKSYWQLGSRSHYEKVRKAARASRVVQ